MDHVRWLVFLKDGSGLGLVSTQPSSSTREGGGGVPQVSVFGSKKDPLLIGLLGIGRGGRGTVDDVFNGLADESAAASDKNDGGGGHL